MNSHCIIAFRRWGIFIPLGLVHLLISFGFPQRNEADTIPYAKSSLPATATLESKAHPMLGDTIQLVFSLTAKQNLKGIRVVVRAGPDVFLVPKRNLLAEGISLKKGETHRFSFQATFPKKYIYPDEEIWVEAGIPSSDPSYVFSEIITAGKQWVLTSDTAKVYDHFPYRLPADCEIQIKEKPKLGETVDAAFCITPQQDLNGIRVMIRGSGLDILDMISSKMDGKLSDPPGFVLADKINLKKGEPCKFPFRVRIADKPTRPRFFVSIVVVAGIPSEYPAFWFEESVSAGRGWIGVNEKTGELKPSGT